MPPLTFRSEDEEAQYCLSALRDGTHEEKIVARERLAAIFARRGLYDEVAELYELNIRAGVRSPEVFEDLSEVYRHLGDLESAEAALAEARRVRSLAQRQPAQASDAPSPPTPSVDSRVIPFPSQSPSRQPEHAPAGAGSGSHPGLSAASGVSASTAAALTPQVATQLAPDAARSPYAAPAPPDSARRLAQLNDPDLEAAPQAADAEQTRRARRSVPGPVLVVGVVLFMIVLPVTLLALFVVNPLSLYLEGRAAGPIVEPGADPPPMLKIAPGASATWYLQTGRSVSGLWASPGLELTLAQTSDGIGGTYNVTGPRSQSWGETITIVERRGQGRANQETVVPATFQAPAVLPPTGTVLDGRIAGQITAPRLSESSQFNTTSQNVDVPVQLVVVSGFDLWLDRFGNALRMFFDEDRWLLVTIGAILSWCVLAGGAALLFRARKR